MAIVVKKWRIIDLINWGTEHFSSKGIENSRSEIEWFLCNVLNFERIDLYVKFENQLKSSELEKLRKMIKRRINGEPFQHIIGKAPFYGRDFIVNKNVFIPRPETGILIDRLKKNGKVSTLLDVGTGSGCIAITCALENLSENIYATDIKIETINVAQENLQLHRINDIKITCHDFINNDFKMSYDVVVSNPPYIARDEVESLQREVRNYDPKIALSDGDDGYVFYRCFAKRFDKLINSDGYMLLEIGGNNYKEGVEKIFNKENLKVEFFKDLQGDIRSVEVRK
jgi:release factor glutamine methyltransferase